MSLSTSLNLGADTLILGQGDQDVNLVSKNGRDIKINGIVPSAGGGGGVPPIGDVSFVGNLIVDDNIDNLGNKGNIIFGGKDIYHSTPQVPGQPAVDDISYVTFKQLAEKNETNTFTEINTFKEVVKIQALNADPVPVFVDKISLNKDGSINAEGQLKANGLICENGSTDTNYVKARVFDFRPKGENDAPDNELTGWNFSQKKPDAGAPAEADNYLMLQNTQPTGSFNLVKSSFDPQNPTEFDIILDPQNGKVKTATSFDAPQVNFRRDPLNDAWSISQPPIGDPAEGTLIARSPSVFGSFNILDSASSSWAQFSALATTLPKATTINSTLNVNGNTTLSSISSLLFGAYIFRPQQYSRNITLTIDGTKDTTNFTNMIFNPRDNPSNWTNVNTGATNQHIYNAALAGYYKCTVTQTALSSASNYDGIKVIFDYVLEFSLQTSPDIEPPVSYGYKVKPSGGQPPTIDVDHTNNPVQSQPVFLLFPNQNAGETMEMTVKLTKLDF
jgi:hypothetical protein